MPRANCDSSAKLYIREFATSNADFPPSTLPAVYLPNITTLSLPIATCERVAESLEPLAMFDGEVSVFPMTSSRSSSSRTSAHLALF